MESEAVDPLENLVTFLQNLERLRGKDDPLRVFERERFLAVTLISLLSDPKHPIGLPIMKQILPVYLSRGGKLPIVGPLARHLRETDQLDFAIQYLYDREMSVKEVANILGCSVGYVYNTLNYLRQEDIDLMKDVEKPDESQNVSTADGVCGAWGTRRRRTRLQT